MDEYALVNSHNIDLSDDESITEDDTANTTLGMNVRTGRNRLRNSGGLPKL